MDDLDLNEEHIETRLAGLQINSLDYNEHTYLGIFTTDCGKDFEFIRLTNAQYSLLEKILLEHKEASFILDVTFEKKTIHNENGDNKTVTYNEAKSIMIRPNHWRD